MEQGDWAGVRDAIARAPEPPPGWKPVYDCSECEDRGLVTVDTNGFRRAVQCRCLRERVLRQRLERCGIPRKFAGVRLAGFSTAGADPSIGWAVTMARGIVDTFPLRQGNTPAGLLMTGNAGIGKTHLAATILTELVMERGASGRFWQEGDLLLELKRSFSSGGEGVTARSEGDIFEELKRADVLVLDDLASTRSTDWSFDVVWQAIAARYNSHLLTVITSNVPNLGVGEGRMVGGVREQTLGDKIGARAWSRLQEMCRAVEMVGADFRRKKV